MESAAQIYRAAIQQVQRVTSVYAQHLIDMNRHLEDMNNRGRRPNLMGNPESVKGPQLQSVLWQILNTFLGRPPDTPMEIEKCHRALRPRGRENDPPRDVI